VLQPVAEAAARMAEQHGADALAADLELTLAQLAVVHVGRELTRRDREVRALHLRREQLA